MTTKSSVICFVVGLILAACQFGIDIVAEYRYEKEYLQFWELAVKSSTIAAKQQYVSQFVEALESGRAKGEFAGYNAIFLKTPDNSFDKNYEAVKTLESRLTEIRQMDPASFQYNTAIEQITKQEQGEAAHLLDVLAGCYFLRSYPEVWGWIGLAVFDIASLISFVGLGALIWKCTDA